MTPEFGYTESVPVSQEVKLPPPSLDTNFDFSKVPPLPQEAMPARTWPGKEQGLPPPMTPEFGYMESAPGPAALEQEQPIKKESYLGPAEIKKNLLEGEQPLTKEEKIQFLKPEYLSELSTEEYMQVWKRLHPNFVSHVTRQGYRENSWMSHKKGLHKFNDSFVELLRGGKELASKMGRDGIRTPADARQSSLTFLENIDFEKIEKDSYGNELHPNPWKKLKEHLTYTWANAEKIPDELAVHLASNHVLDQMYGAETDNQIFAVYPSDMVASQYDFSSGARGHSFTENNYMDPTHNDVFVWNKQDPLKTSLSLDSGLVFIPRTTLVDSETGSKYASYVSSTNEEGAVGVKKTLPEKPVSAETYWEDYFAKNPTLRPKHVVYYDGDPTEAVDKFLKTNGVEEKGEPVGGDLGFQENDVNNEANAHVQGDMEKKVLREAALATKLFLTMHPEYDSWKYDMGPSDHEEMDALLKG